MPPTNHHKTVKYMKQIPLHPHYKNVIYSEQKQNLLETKRKYSYNM